MTPARPLMLAFAALGLVWASVSLGHYRAAVARAESARDHLRITGDGLREARRLRDTPQVAIIGRGRVQDLTGDVRAALAKAELPDAALRDLRQESDGPAAQRATDELVPSIAYRAQQILVHIEPVTVAQLGKFLAAWRAAKPAWRIERIELTHAGPATEVSYAARITLATLYVEETRAPILKTSPSTNSTPEEP